LKIIETDLPGCLVIEPRVFSDHRGYFYETFNSNRFGELGLPHEFLQGNVSLSRRGVLRGLHYQWPNPQGKYVTVLDGEIWDVAVDIRVDSPTRGRSAAVVLNSANHRHLWIPKGFAHGFVALSETALVSYLCTETYDAAADSAIRWDDPDLAVDWPVSSPSLSAKDLSAPLLSQIPVDRLPRIA
jgi:dTDP-4-dehydrorhamnose 3,5-epimerase